MAFNGSGAVSPLRRIAPVLPADGESGEVAVFGRGQHLFYRPSLGQPTPNGRIINAKLLGPFSDGLALPIEINDDVAPPIPLLLFARCPSAVLRRIAFVIVDAIKGVNRAWALAHVGQEVGEFKPGITDSDATPAVILEEPVIWVGATLAHGKPNAIFRQLGMPIHIFSRDSSKSTGAATLGMKASAGCAATRNKVMKPYGFLRTAIAKTQTLPIFPILELGQNCEA